VRALVAALRTQAAVRGARYARDVQGKRWPRPRFPHREVLHYYRRIRYFVEQSQYVIRRDIFPALPGLLQSSQVQQAPVVRSDTADDIDKAIAQAAAATAQAVPDRDIRAAATQTALRVSETQGNDLQGQIQKVAKINLFDDTTGLAQHLELFVSDNVALIKSIPASQLEAVKGVIVRGARAGKHHREVQDELVAQFGITRRRAALIASDQIGKLNGELNQLRQTNVGVRRYRWSTSQDERVRPAEGPNKERLGHRKLNGTIQEWSKPPLTDERTGERAHPGQPIRCRCVAIPIIDDVLADAGLIAPEDVETTQPRPGEQPPLRVPPGPTPQPANVPALTPTPTVRPPPAPMPPKPPPAPPPVTPPPRLPVVVHGALPKPAANDAELERQAGERRREQELEALKRAAAARMRRIRLEQELADHLAAAETAAAAGLAAEIAAAQAAEAAANAAYEATVRGAAVSIAAAAAMRKPKPAAKPQRKRPKRPPTKAVMRRRRRS
jgi:SPP1 gp7 family putative phage head morphogenesis protein